MVFQKSLACHCDEYGSVDVSCDESGVCTCKSDYEGLKCDLCREGMYGFPNCEGIWLRNLHLF